MLKIYNVLVPVLLDLMDILWAPSDSPQNTSRSSNLSYIQDLNYCSLNLIWLAS